MSKIEVDAIEPQSGTTLTLGASGDTITVPSGATLSSTDPLVFPAGSAASPAITTTGDTNTGIFFPAADTIGFAEGGSEAMRINSSGIVGIGTSSPSDSVGFGSAVDISSSTGGGVYFRDSDSPSIAMYLGYVGSNSTGYVWNQANGPILFGTNDTEAMRINSSGSLIIGATAVGAAEKLRLYSPFTTNATFLFNFGNANGAVFQAENSGRLKTGTQSQSPYNYAVTGRDVYVSSGGLLGYLSSIRDSKTNIENISDVSWLYQLNPVSFNYKVQDEQGNYTEEAEADKFYGLIAEEVETVNPDICFYKNNKPEDGLAGVDYKKLYAPIIKALQEQQTKIQELEARITALENA